MTVAYIRDILSLLALVSGVRESDFERHSKAERQMLKGYGANYLGRKFATVHGVLVTEYFNRETKRTAGPFSSGYSTNIDTTNKWVKTVHIHAKLRLAMRDKLNINTTSTHKELTDSRKTRHSINVDNLKKKLYSYNTDPFSKVPAKAICTGVEADKEIIQSLLKRLKLRTGVEKVKETPTAISVLTEDQQAFGILVAKAMSLDKAFSFPITTLPLGLATPDGTLWQSDKASIRNYSINESKAASIWFTGSQLPRSLIRSKSRTGKENDVDGCEANMESEPYAVPLLRKKRKRNTRRSVRPIETEDDVHNALLPLDAEILEFLPKRLKRGPLIRDDPHLCEDHIGADYCQYLKKHRTCIIRKERMAFLCNRTCGYCKPPPPECKFSEYGCCHDEQTPAKGKDFKGCEGPCIDDISWQCKAIKFHGLCKKLKFIVLNKCRKTCDLCDDKDPCSSHTCPKDMKCEISSHGFPQCICKFLCHEGDTLTGRVCGRDGKEYEDLCALKQRNCNGVKVQKQVYLLVIIPSTAAALTPQHHAKGQIMKVVLIKKNAKISTLYYADASLQHVVKGLTKYSCPNFAL
eukprot:gene15673-6963_t